MKVTMKLLEELYVAQLKNTQGFIEEALAKGWGVDLSCDGCDYLRSSLEMSRVLHDFLMNRDTRGLNQLLNTKDAFIDYAGDGICREIRDLKPAALDFD